MADFWGGVAKGFGPSYESALARREREEKEEKADKARKTAAALAARIRNEDRALAQEKYDTKQEQERDARALAGRQYETEQTRLDQKDEEARQVVARAKEERLRGLRNKIAATGIPQQQEAFKIRGGFPMEGLEPGVDARTLAPTPEQSRALSEDELGVIGARSTALQEEMNKIAADKRAKAAKLDPTFKHPATPKSPIGDVVDEIIQMQGQLGDKVPKQTREALAIMGQGPLRRLHGGLTERLAVRKREQVIADYKEKGVGLSGSTRGYKEAAEAGLRYSELLEDIEKGLKEGKEPDPSTLREMKSNMAHVMAFYSHPGRLVPPHLEDLVRGAGRIPNNTILTDMALSHEMSMYAQSLGKDVSHLMREYGKEKLTAFIGPIQAPLSELLTTFGINDKHPDRLIVNRLRQKYGDMANYKLFLQSGKAVTEQEYNRLKAVVGNPEREDFLDKLLGYAQLEKERTQRKFKAYTDAGLRFNPDLEKGIFGEARTQGQEGLSSAEETQLKKYQDAKAAGLLGEEDKLKYRELLLKKLRK
jgi:hypothetical protein